MLNTLRAVVEGDHIRWEDDPGKLLPSGQAKRALITILDSPEDYSTKEVSERRISAIRKLAALNPFREIQDPVEWQRANRVDRDLPGRE